MNKNLLYTRPHIGASFKLAPKESRSAPDERNTQRTKHFEIRKNFVSDRILQNFIRIEHIRTAEQQADLLTKSLSGDKVKRFMQLLRIYA